MTRSVRHVVFVNLGVALAAALATSGIAYATSPSPSNVITGCYGKSTGDLRVLNVRAGNNVGPPRRQSSGTRGTARIRRLRGPRARMAKLVPAGPGSARCLRAPGPQGLPGGTGPIGLPGPRGPAGISAARFVSISGPSVPDNYPTEVAATVLPAGNYVIIASVQSTGTTDSYGSTSPGT